MNEDRIQEWTYQRNQQQEDISLSMLEKYVCQPVVGKELLLKVGIFAGIHGDEPAGIKAAKILHRWSLTRPPELDGYELHLYPACNPSGIKASSRRTAMGFDLNREFWCGSKIPEVRYLEYELRRERYDVIISLHEDDTSHGLYGFVSGHLLSESILRPALKAAAEYLPINESEIIDGFPSAEGMIKEGYHGVLCAPPEQRPKALEIVFETPGREPVNEQAVAAAVAVKTMLVEYRKYLAYGENL